MLIEFKVSNFRSIGEEQTLSLVPASNQKDFLKNIIENGKNSSLNVIAVYGANGSGKTNILRALAVFCYLIERSAKLASTDVLIYDPFLLREGWSDKPTFFEIIFSINELRYRYGFVYNEKRILKEWLYRKNLGREVKVFERESDIIDTSSSLKANSNIIDAAIEATGNNALFLSKLDTFNIEEVNDIFQFFNSCVHIDGMITDHFRNLNATWNNESIKNSVKNHLRRLKLGLVDIEVKAEEESSNNYPTKKEKYKIFSKHILYDREGKPTKRHITWEFLKRESSGSIKALELSSPLVVVLKVGGILVIDEIEAQMHPLLTIDTINLFLNKKTNPNNAQLIFSTHDTNLLSYASLRRDQIYFAEKNEWESTEIYSLSDFVYIDQLSGKEMKERPDTDKEKRYIEGRYGAIPVLGSMSKLKSNKNG